MSIRAIVRPPGIISTPRVLKQALGASLIIKPLGRKPDWFSDFFLYYPAPQELLHYAQTTPPSLRIHVRSESLPRDNRHTQVDWLENYKSVYAFTSGTKPQQRTRLAGFGFPIPPTFERQSTAAASRPSFFGKYVVRPKRHRSGIGWRLTDTVTDFNEQTEYIQELYPKNHEYRIIAVRGEPLVTLLKRVPEGTPRSTPWNHSCGSTFITVTDPNNDRLRHTNVYNLIRSTSLFKHMDLIGIDVLYRRDDQYVVSEINTCPALTIPSSIEKVASHVHRILC